MTTCTTKTYDDNYNVRNLRSNGSDLYVKKVREVLDDRVFVFDYFHVCASLTETFYYEVLDVVLVPFYYFFPSPG